MPNYLAYPKSVDTPSRLTRKQSRKNVFLKNKRIAKDAKKARLEAKQEVLEAQEG